jgi:subtilisin family serine protease
LRYSSQNSEKIDLEKHMKNEGTPIDRQQLEQLIFGGELSRRFTQDSPILPDVWVEYGTNPGQRVDLLLNPYAELSPGKVFQALRNRLKAIQRTDQWKERHHEGSTSAELAYNQSTVVAKLYFDELIQVVLPLTAWWKKYIIKNNLLTNKKSPSFQRFISDKKNVLHDLKTLQNVPTSTSGLKYPPEWLWMVKVIGKICYSQSHNTDVLKIPEGKCFDIFSSLINSDVKLDSEHESLLWTVTLNRKATIAMWRSTLAVKADAARLLFNTSCKDINWAVIDSGIDATHPAFRNRNSKGIFETLPKSGDWTNKTRIKATYDFRKMRKILAAINDSLDATSAEEMPAEIKKILSNLFPASTIDEMSFDQRVKTLQDALNYGYYINWDVLKPVLLIKHDQNYEAPRHEHGTHVAGILAGCWKKDENKLDEGQDLIGVCPDLNLYDLRVLDDHGTGDEFSILGALQFIRYLNSHKEYISVHGVNLSLSIRHDVVNYACGCTPVCEECNRLVNAGTVVVAAAGNQGYLQYLMADGKPTEGYRSISVTDPGNAEGVITVGSTHALLPHSYGVSYFSSRGPTGDGRIKPDLVAPGEKINSCIPGSKSIPKDGTSMAAPHVSGAAALLMARHSELLGRPQLIKEILCKTATDLGREKYFQGAGMVDILRALQSV